jgi:hypothetical protein
MPGDMAPGMAASHLGAQQKDKVVNDKILAQLNQKLEPIMCAKWELVTSMCRLNLRNKRGLKLK